MAQINTRILHAGNCSVKHIDWVPRTISAGDVFVFNASTTNFGAVVARLTDGVDDPLSTAMVFRDASDVLTGGRGSTTSESFTLGESFDFIGEAISSIRLTVNTFSLQEVPGPFGRVRSEFSTDVDWEIIGDLGKNCR